MKKENKFGLPSEIKHFLRFFKYYFNLFMYVNFFKYFLRRKKDFNVINNTTAKRV